MKLYELSNEIEKHLEAYNQVDNQEGLDAVEKQLDSLEMAFKDKAISVAHFIKNCKSDIDQIDIVIGLLSVKKRRLEVSVNGMKSYLKKNMINTNHESIETPITKISFRKSRHVDVIDESKVPEKYFRTTVVRSVVKSDVLADWDAGIGVDGVKVVEEKNLQIK